MRPEGPVIPHRDLVGRTLQHLRSDRLDAPLQDAAGLGDGATAHDHAARRERAHAEGAERAVSMTDRDAVEIDAELLVRNLGQRSEEHTSELQSLMRNSYAVFCLKKKKKH